MRLSSNCNRAEGESTGKRMRDRKGEGNEGRSEGRRIKRSKEEEW
jgi:hypothetical protein